MSGVLQPSLDVIIRDPVRSDQQYIASTWYRSALGHKRAAHRRRKINALIDRVLDHEDTQILVAAAIDDPERIIGWLAYATTPIMRIVHYAYVREGWREQGIARRLVVAAWPDGRARMVLTCRGPCTRRYLATHRHVVFVPVEEILI